MRTRALAAAFIALAVAAAPLASAADAVATVAPKANVPKLNAPAKAANAVAPAPKAANAVAPAKAANAGPAAGVVASKQQKNNAAAAAAPATLFAAISARPELSSFAAALRLIGVDDELSQPDARTTVFAPTNAALDAFAKEVIGNGDKTAAAAVDNKALLSERYVTLLRRVAANAAGVDPVGNGVYTTYGGQDVRLAKKEGGSTAAELVATALPAARGVEASVVGGADGTIDLGNNGRVYVVDRVLRPADVLVADEATLKKAATGGRQSSNGNNAKNAAAAAAAPNPNTLRWLLAADADVSHFARLLQLLAPELVASAASAPLTVFAPRNAAINAYLERAHGLKSVDDVDKAVTVALPAAAKAVETTAAAATAAAASGAKSTKPSDSAAAAAVAAADAQKELQRLLALRANLTAAVAYHVSPGLAVDGATLLEGGRLMPTLLAARAGLGAAEDESKAAVPVVAAANGVVEGGAEAAGAKAGSNKAAAVAAPAKPTTPPATKMIGARAGGNGHGAPVMLGDFGSSALVLKSTLAGDDALHVIDAVLLASADPAAEGPSPGVAIVGGDGDIAVLSADGLTSVAVAPTSGNTTSSSSDASGARGGYDLSIRNQIIQNSMQSNIVRALSGSMSVHTAAMYNSALANMAPYSTPYFYLMNPYGTGIGYGGYAYGNSGAYSGYWMG